MQGHLVELAYYAQCWSLYASRKKVAWKAIQAPV